MAKQKIKPFEGTQLEIQWPVFLPKAKLKRNKKRAAKVKKLK